MSEIKPVYQVKRFDETGWTDVTQESCKSCELAQTVLETRILYPAAAYEALKAENEAQVKRIAELEKYFEKLKNDCKSFADCRERPYSMTQKNKMLGLIAGIVFTTI